MSIIVAVAPHPDDETLGCGGTLLRHKAQGDEIHWLIMTTISQEAGFSKEQIDSRSNEIKHVAEAYGFSSFHQAGFIAAELDTAPRKRLIAEVSDYLNKTEPDTIYLPHHNDAHSDHEIVFDTVSVCAKPFRYPYVRRMRVYETLSESGFGIRSGDSGFKPNLWVDISEHLERKIEIMRMYKGEMREHPFPRSEQSLRALSCLRGARAGQQASEAFMTLLEII